MADLKKLKAFPVAGSSVTLWIFNKRTVKDSAPAFAGRWAEVGEDLAAALRDVASNELARIEETIEYSLLAQNNEASSLSIPVIETHADVVKSCSAAETNERRIKDAGDIGNFFFYVVKFSHENDILLGVKKADPSWKTRKKLGFIPFLFEDNTLVLDTEPSFNLSRYFDFLVYDDYVYVKAKSNFESVLEYKTAHKDDFVALCGEPEFASAFVDLEELKKFVGTNKMQLRRMAAIHQKKHYKNSTFMQNLRKHHARAGLKIDFDKNNKIIPSQETCRDILQALLDFRLLSMFSSNFYDVPDTSAPS